MQGTMTIAVLGTGIMGAGMVRNWLAAGESVRVWNRTRTKAAPLAEAGAQVTDDPAAAVDGADVIVTMLYDADAVEGAMRAAAPGLRPGTLWLQMSTVGVDGAQRLAALADEFGLTYVDAPVLGTRQPAEQGKLTVLASGPDEVRDRVERLVTPIAAQVRWLGPAGTGSRLKLVVNNWVLNVVAGVADSIALAEGLGLRGSDFLDLIQGGALDIPYAHVKGDLMLRREFPPSFPVSGALKDAWLIVDAGRAADIDVAVVEAIAGLLDAVAKSGRQDEDLAAMYRAVRRSMS
jgi:3-hydroxyisobutyrate dehydrogenase